MRGSLRTALVSLAGLLLVLVVLAVGLKVLETLVKRSVRAAIPGSRVEPVKPETVVVTVDSFIDRWHTIRERTERMAGNASGENGLPKQWWSVLKGETVRQPAVVTLTDSAVARVPPPQVIVDEGGRLSVGGVWEDSAGVRRGTSAEGIRTADCDDGWRMSGTVMVCNRARLGHLSIVAEGSASAPFAALPALRQGERESLTLSCGAGPRWEPAYRSTNSVTLLARCDGRVEARVQVGVVRIF